ncbi:MAG: two-component regulator propeller domain-containing protein [Bacteroidales bacterium]|nr:two-component regulator propeller domain-containing protein [Bacteroidales bacterium]
MKIFISCAILIIFPLSYLLSQAHYIYPQTEKYRFQHLTTENGLPANWCYQVMKDSRGFMWITTRAGLCRYDGYNIKVYQNVPDDSSSLSNNRITRQDCILEDQKGNIWVGTLRGLNRFDPVSEKFYPYYKNEDKTGSIGSNIITCLYEDRSGTLWIGTSAQGGLNRFNPSENTFNKFYPVSNDSTKIVPGILSLLVDSKERFWVGTTRGLFLFNRENGLFTSVIADASYPEMKTPLYCSSIHEDLDGTIFIGTRQGFIYYDTISGQVIPYKPLFHPNMDIRRTDFLPDHFDNKFTHWIISIVGLYGFNKNNSYLARIRPDPPNDQSISGNALSSIFREETGLIWVPGNFGVNILDPVRQRIKNYPGVAGDYGEATCFLEDSKGYLWKGSNHLEKLDPNLNLIDSYQFPLKNKGIDSFGGAVFCILEDSRGNIWVGNDYNGLFVLKNGGNELVQCYFTRSGVTYIWDIIEDSSGRFWVATNSGLFFKEKRDLADTEFYRLPEWDVLNSNVVLDIEEDSSGNIWVGTAGFGLYYQNYDERETGYIHQLLHDPEDKYSLSNNIIWALHEDDSGCLWVATEHGLNRRINEENRFIRYFNDTDPGSNYIYDLINDAKGSLWLTTESGLFKFTPNQGDVDSLASGIYRKILPFNDIFPHRIYKNSSGQVFIGGAYNSGKGYYSFHPDGIFENKNIPPIVITSFKVNNSEYNTDTVISLKNHIILNHDQNFFSFECSALDFLDPEKNQYAHYLEGLEDDWIYTGNNRIATYTEVPPGNYTFHVKGSNNSGLWNEKGTSISVTIFPPPWKTWWAYLIYSIVFLAIVYSIIRFFLKRLQLLHKLEIEKVEAKKMKELDSMKSRFFANISHEFRTPLTLILGPLEKTLTSVSGEVKNNLVIMQRNAHRLQKLINELLNLSRLEAGEMKLQASRHNLVEVVNGYVQSFESLAKHRHIELSFQSEHDDIQVYFDQEKLEIVLNNILSNAFKFTTEGGQITITVRSQITNHKNQNTYGLDYDCAIISISDTGSGISPENLPHIFDRFYQANDPDSQLQEGTGIGLALTKELVELHHGRITVESIAGKGSAFNVILPLGKDHLKEEEVILVDGTQLITNYRDSILEYDIANQQPVTSDQEQETITANDLPLLLLVEDNSDLRAYIRDILGKSYQLREARDGEEGLSIAMEILPDLIISDVMMPKLDGYDLCRRLKTDERTSHIPVILLTARAGMESKIEGLETGADDFITKPFDRTELETRIRNILRQRISVRKNLMKELKRGEQDILVSFPVSGLNEKDRQFLNRAIKLIEKHLTDTDFSTEFFSNEMALSRSQLHRKLNSIINLSATEFVRTIRLNKAAALLKTGSATISEIAFDVGFSTLAYFTRSFKEQFGVTPSEFAKRS